MKKGGETKLETTQDIYPVVLYYRTYDVILDEQKKLNIVNYNSEFTLREFVDANNPYGEYNELSIVINGEEVKILDCIVIDGRMRFNQDINTVRLKDLESELRGIQLTIYISEENAVGDATEEIAQLLLVFALINQSINFILNGYAIRDIILKNKIKPITLRKAVLKKNEWSLRDFCETFEIDSLEQAGKILRYYGFKKDNKTNNYRSKDYNEKNNPYDVNGVG